jgi:hypothetical protein
MNLPVRDTITTELKLVVNWLPQNVPENGYIDIVSYNLQWDRGSQGATWYNLIGFDTASIATTFTSTETLAPGHWYQFKVRSQNIFGWSAFSDILLIKAATWPSDMSVVSTTVEPT